MSDDFLNLEKKPSNRDFTTPVLILFLLLIVVIGFVFFKEYMDRRTVSQTSQVLHKEHAI